MTAQTITPIADPQLSTETERTELLRAEALRGLCGGQVHLPGDPGYDAARTAWNLAVDQRPAAVAVPRSAQDVSEVVRAAVAAGLRVAPQSTGHAAGALAQHPLGDAVLLRTLHLTDVSVDYPPEVLDALAAMDETVRVRLLS